MLKQHRRAIITVIVVNVLLVLFFVYINYTIWNYFNSNFNSNNNLGTIQMNPTWISGYIAGYLSKGNFIPTGYFLSTPNLPFWLFFVSTAINLIFIFYFVLSSETKQNHSQNSTE
jgi:TRAP-type C4-dicarboxylate transport system permease small subunit